MDKKHIAAVKKSIAILPEGESRPFYFALEDDRAILHVGKKPGEESAFGNVAKINRHLKSKSYGDPLGDEAVACAGQVYRSDGQLVFDVNVKRGAGNSDLKDGLKKLKLKLVLGEYRIGSVKAKGESPAPSEPPPQAPAPKAADEDPRLQKLLREIQAAIPAFEAGRQRMGEQDFEKLYRRLRKYTEQGGKADLKALRAAVRTEWKRRLDEEKAALARESAEMMRKAASGEAVELSPEQLGRFQKAADRVDLESEIAGMPEEVQEAARALRSVYAASQPEIAALMGQLDGSGLGSAERAAALSRLGALQAAIQSQLSALQGAIAAGGSAHV